MAIRKRHKKDGKVVYDVRVQYGGLRTSRTVPTTYTEAKRLESKLLQDLINGKFAIIKGAKNPLFKEYAKEYMESVTWQKSYERTCRILKFLVAYFGNMRLSQITMSDFINYRTERLKDVKPATINREYSCLKRMLNIAVQSDDYIISRNSLRSIKKLEEQPVEDRVLSVDEYHKLLEVAPEYFKRIVFFACNTAMRRMEILKLKFRQIRTLLNGVEVVLIDTKSGKRETVPLNNETIELLETIAKERGIDLYHLDEKSGDEYIFLGTTGKPLRDLRHPMKLTYKKAGIPYRPFHTFRHFWTSEMFSAGVDVAKIKKIGRWRDLKTMLRYCHSQKLEEQEAINALSMHLKRKQPEMLPFTKFNN